jgi:hypothetical protein
MDTGSILIVFDIQLSGRSTDTTASYIGFSLMDKMIALIKVYPRERPT